MIGRCKNTWIFNCLTIAVATFCALSRSQTCRVIDGRQKGSECIFPFRFNGSIYDGCILEEVDPQQSSFAVESWCSTEVDEFHNHVSGKGSWGHCSPECPLAPTKEYDYEEEESISCTLSDGRWGSCQPFGICAGFLLDDQDSGECSQGEGSSFVCCPESTSSNVNLNLLRAAFGNAKDGLSQVKSIPSDTERHINEKLNSVLNARRENELLFRFGPNIALEPNRTVESSSSIDTPIRMHRLFNRPRKGALRKHEIASDLREVADNTFTNASSSIGLRSLDFNARTVSLVNETCPWTGEGAPSCGGSFHTKYRSADGSCNSLDNPNLGRAETPFQRILPAAYAENARGNFKYSMPRHSKISGSRLIKLPSARLVSTHLTVSAPDDTESDQGMDKVHTTMVMQMGQFIDHDLTHSPTFQFEDPNQKCCDGGHYPSFFDPEECFPIRVPEDDPFWKGQSTCMEFTRSLTAPNIDCSFNFKEQMNQITHWLDNSNIYGSDEHETMVLREGSLGRLRTTTKTSRSTRHPHDLPKCAAYNEQPGMCDSCPTCYVAGDDRANEQLNLLAFHTIWMREHNRVAKALNRLNPKWDDETLFQEARRIVTAEYQHIVYKEWLPLVLGKTYMDAFHLWPLSKGYSNVYLDSFDPRVTNEFAAAGFRFGHSLIPHSFQSGLKTRKTRDGFTHFTLREIFFKPEMLSEKQDLIDQLTEGLFAQNGQSWDNQFTTDITNHLFEAHKGSGGMDLVALNIQRGRDHGLPGYNEYRKMCKVGRGKATNWTDFEDYIDSRHIRKLKEVYRHIDDVDLFVGGFLERRLSDSPLGIGPTFKCIIGDTFARLKMGDRFFYDLQDLPGKTRTKRFTPRQLRNIRKTSMARILCDNTDIGEVQPQVFKMETSSVHNKKRSCRDFRNIPHIDFGGFRDRDPIFSDFFKR